MATPGSPEWVLTRGVQSILPSRQTLLARMQEGPIRLYLGIDPTGSQLHLGHAVVLRKLQQFAELGNDVILLIGNGTVKIGDPTGKDQTRPMLSDAEIEAHFQTWKSQAEHILDFDRIRILHNGDWLDELKFPEIIRLCAQMTVQQLLERDMFQDRLKNNVPIHAHEMLYPLLQGFDSVAMDVDLEIGGNDQLFNMMVGRHLMQTMKQKEKWALAVELLVGSDGRKMGKSLQNFIPLDQSPENMYGQLMSITDSVIPDYFRLLTDVSDEELAEITAGLQSGSVHPMDAKKQVAQLIVTSLFDSEQALAAASHFEKTVQQGEIPEDVASIEVDRSAINSLVDLVAAMPEMASRSEARRLIEQGGVTWNGISVTDPFALPENWQSGGILKVGKRRYFDVRSRE